MDSTYLDNTARQHWVDRQAPYSPVPVLNSSPRPGGPSGGVIDLALLESGLTLLQHASNCWWGRPGPAAPSWRIARDLFDPGAHLHVLSVNA